MSTILSADEALTSFLEFKEMFSKLKEENINEATTRLKMIDEFFIKVLGWPKEMIEVELEIGDTAQDNSHKKIYADYMAYSDHNQFIIEAKRTGRYFEIPQGRTKNYKSTASIYNDKNKEFIDQAKRYMYKLGTPYCVLTNGYQFIIIRRSFPNMDKDTIVFRDLDEIERDFVLFWAILNPHGDGPGAIDNYLKAPLEIRQIPSLSLRLYDKIRHEDKYILRQHQSIVATETYLNRFFGDLTVDAQIDLLEKCYCDPFGTYKDFASQLKRKIEPLPIAAITPIKGRDELFKTKSNFEKQYLENLQKNPGSVYVLLGEVGAGKSTFLKHFYCFELQDEDRDNIIWIRLDFLDFNKPVGQLNNFISEQILKRLDSTEYNYMKLDEWETIKRIYQKEFHTFKVGMPPSLQKDEDFIEQKIWELSVDYQRDLEFRLKKTIDYISTALNKSVCFVFDNIDQKTIDEQKEVLLIAHERATAYGSTVITAMRFQSFNLIKNKPPYDALQTITYRIQPPNAGKLLEKRLEALEDYPQEQYVYEYGNKTVKIPISKFVKILKNTLDKSPEQQVEKLFEELSGGNMRRLLIMFKTAILSENTRLYEVLDFINEIKNIDNTALSYDQVLEGIVREDNRYYSSEECNIFNLFNYQSDGFYSHLTNIYILKYLEECSHAGEQYVDLNDLLERFSSTILDRQKLEIILTPLLNEYLINSDIGGRDSLIGTNAVQISYTGLYYINVLLSNWKYIFNMMVDTSIRDREHFKNLNEYFRRFQSSRNRISKDRLAYGCVTIFLEYLALQETEDLKYFKPKTTTGKSVVDIIIREANASFQNYMNNVKVSK
ncbi:hypothetical protein C2I18_14455 [Paenibacillus sp. PK3_47]|uniref:type I restriction enzyme HsdR N-terminal domain-containing protein n=1 Tax=Paenibacillus sp. PK3_47 TaxID=2072642 RepID=UPI00201D6E6F|nr:type I restriction enzyme HsdR N-terminal domain-containing protein [Paenibacillus sp. PK3_47]UQZ34620.1 hypothetical protein C2I18_14455 [Paenibacillus sp. PK3_47]